MFLGEWVHVYVINMGPEDTLGCPSSGAFHHFVVPLDLDPPTGSARQALRESQGFLSTEQELSACHYAQFFFFSSLPFPFLSFFSLLSFFKVHSGI